VNALRHFAIGSLLVWTLGWSCGRGALLATAAPGARTAASGQEVSLPRDSGSESIRIGLRSDLDAWQSACCLTTFRGMGAEEGWRVHSAATVRPLLGGAAAGTYRVQVAALSDEKQAHDLARSLAKQLSADTGRRVDGSVAFDAERGLFKIRLGAFIEREPAEVLRDGLELRGHLGAWVVSESSIGERIAFEVNAGGYRQVFAGRWLRVEQPSAVVDAGTRYRGSLLLFINERGRLNVINELPLSDYLRGVVPKELGPETYPQLEALKAQAVAARTYALSQRGSFAGEGFDLCATPKCQVYGGLAAEHPLSDRAVHDTLGEVLWSEGALAETLYTATCGGHTEDVRAIFPRRQGMHLVGVPCIEGGSHRLVSAPQTPASAREATLLRSLMERLVPRAVWLAAASSATPEQVAGELDAALVALANAAGLPEPGPAAAGLLVGSPTLASRSVAQRVDERFDLILERELLGRTSLERLGVLVEEGRSLLEETGREGDWRTGEPPRISPIGESLSPVQAAQLVLALSLRTKTLHWARAQHLALTPDSLTALVVQESVDRQPPISADRALQERWVRQEFERSPALALFTRPENGAQPQAVTETHLVPGDAVEYFVLGKQIVAAVVPPPWRVEPVLEDRGTWRRFRSSEELQRLVGERIPGFEVTGLEVLARGGSGRVTRMQILGRDGEQAILEGLPIRWTLDLPDTLFSMQRLDGRGGYLFQGRGWGHGVGLCQVGAVGMARYGHDYRQILRHYYEGAQVVSTKQLARLVEASP
jgi:stage II sporulation protein D